MNSPDPKVKELANVLEKYMDEEYDDSYNAQRFFSDNFLSLASLKYKTNKSDALRKMMEDSGYEDFKLYNVPKDSPFLIRWDEKEHISPL